MNGLYDELVEKTEREISAGAPLSETPTRIFFEHLEEHEQLYRVLLSSQGAQAMMQRLMGYMAKRVSGNIEFNISQHPAGYPR